MSSTSNNANAPPSTYQIGAGAPVNQQYLQSQGPPHGIGNSQQPQQQSAPQQQQPHLPPGYPDSYAPPPAPQYSPGAPDIPAQSSQQRPLPTEYMMSGGAGEPGQASQQQYHAPPSQQGGGGPQPLGQHFASTHGGGDGQVSGHGSQQQYYPSPPRQGGGVSHELGQGLQAYYPPPPQQGSTSPHVFGPQQYYPPSPQQHVSDGYHDAVPPAQPPRPDQQISGQTTTQGGASSQPSGHTSQQYYPPPPQQHIPSGYYGPNPPAQPSRPSQQVPGQTTGQGGVSPQPSKQTSQQHYPPPPQQHAPDGYHDAVPPAQPPRPNQQISGQAPQQYQPETLTTTAAGGYPVPPRRHSAQFGDDDPSSPIHYTRDPHKLVAYLVPFPKPVIKGVAPAAIPDRFLIYTPPPPPLSKPQEGTKEDKLHKVQRKWQEEVRAAKTSDAKTASWKGVKGKATKGISYVMSKTTTSNLDFVNRIPGAKADPKDHHADDGVNEGDMTHKTVGLEEMVLVYPSSYGANPDQVKMEFINTMMRTKSKAQRDAVIATGLLPVSAAIDIMATLIWPFGGLLEIDSVWAYSSIRGAKTARSVTKRLSSSTTSNPHTQTEEQEMQGDKLRLTFTQSPRIEVLYRYLVTRCRDYDHKHFPTTEVAPTETEVLQAIGWAPSQTGNVSWNWEDEEWETQEVKEDVKSTLGKAAKEWDKWCLAFAKSPEKAMKN